MVQHQQIEIELAKLIMKDFFKYATEAKGNIFASQIAHALSWEECCSTV